MSTCCVTHPEISLDDPRLHTPEDGTWRPPSDWTVPPEDDGRSWLESMAARGLRCKATNAFGCQSFFVSLLEFSNHFTRLGLTTCHCKTCLNCGTGKMRAHRMWSVNQKRYAAITSEACRTISLTIYYSSPAESLDAYIQRIESSKHYLAALRRRMRREFSGEHGFMMSAELDPRRQNVVFRLYCLGHDPGAQWFRATWQRIVGVRAFCESRAWDAAHAKEALRWTLDSFLEVLKLGGVERAAWEAALQDHRMTSCVGCLRGVQVDEGKEELPTSGDPKAPYGYCPCGCGGIVTKLRVRRKATFATFAAEYKIVERGRVKDYGGYSPKADRDRRIARLTTMHSTVAAHSPPT